MDLAIIEVGVSAPGRWSGSAWSAELRDFDEHRAGITGHPDQSRLHLKK